MEAATQFYRSQIGDTAVINYCYTDMPWRLLMKDISYFFKYAWALPWILFPLRPFGSGELDELFPSLKNVFCIMVHCILLVLQLIFIVVLPFLVMLPVWTSGLIFGIFMALNWLLCLLLNGKEVTFRSDPKYAESLPEHQHEQWVFLNGVAVGQVQILPYSLTRG